MTLETSRAKAVPFAGLIRRLSGFFEGPMAKISIGINGSRFEGEQPKARPIHLIVDASVVLLRQFTVPVEAKSNIPGAATVLARSQTPFQPEDLHICVSDLHRVDDELHAAALFLPRDAISGPLNQFGIRAARIGKVSLRREAEETPLPELLHLINPALAWRKMLWLVPVLIIALAGGAAAHLRSEQFQLAISSYVAAVDTARARASDISKEIERRQTDLGRAAAIANNQRTSFSLHAIIADVATSLPEGVEITRFEGRGGVVRIFLRADNAIADLDRLNAKLQGFTGSIEGAIQAEPEGRELATIALQAKP